jgi:hypothetical protein
MSNHNKETEARCFHCYRHYVEGTAAWALYMMRMGRKVTNPKYDPRVYYLPEGGMIQIDGMEIIAGNQWIDYWCIDIPDGWEIYEEPKPEPEVKVKVTLEGTVRKSQLNGCFVLDTPMPGNDVHTIRLVELDPNTAELVKALLKAQEGE